MDIGDQKKALIAFQITSTNTRKKIMDTLSKVVQHKWDKLFTNGIKILILNSDGLQLGKAKKQPADVLPSFDVGRDVLLHTHLIARAKEVYETDVSRFNRIMALLEAELNPFYLSQAQQTTAVPIRQIGSFLYQGQGLGGQDLVISSIFSGGGLALPEIHPAAPRHELVSQLSGLLDEHAVLWLSGTPSTGKTAVAVLVGRSWHQDTLWLDCRDITPDQLVEHLLASMLVHSGIQARKNLRETLDAIFDKFDASVLLVLNDVPELARANNLILAVARILTAAQSKGVSVMVTSNFNPPEDLIQNYDVDLVSRAIPPFEESDTNAILTKYGAAAEQLDLFSLLVTRGAEGNPLLIQAGAKFLKSKEWEVDDSTVKAVFTGRYGFEMEKDIYRRVLDTTTDEKTRDLLYRLGVVIGPFNGDIIARLASVEPQIDRPDERTSALTGIWLQETSPNLLQLSPLIRKLGSNLGEDTRKEIYKQLGKMIIAKRKISQIDASTAIFYLIQAEDYKLAAFVLQKTLGEFIGKPQLFFDWGFTMHWYTEPIPEQVPNFFRVQIRVLQLEFTISTDRNASYLVEDLESILSEAGVSSLERAIGNMALFHYYGLSNPLRAFGHLANAKQEFEAIDVPEEVFQAPEFDQELLNGIWYVFTQLRSRAQYNEWFRILQQMNLVVSFQEAYTNEYYRQAGLSILRRIEVDNSGEVADCIDLLDTLIASGIEYRAPLLSAYALKSKVRFLATVALDVEASERAVVEHDNLWRSEPLFRFLVFEELARQFFYGGNPEKAQKYLDPIRDIAIPNAYSEELDYLILQTQATFRTNKEQSSRYSQLALDCVLAGNYLLADKIKLFGEAGIGQALLRKWRQALDFYAEGYRLLLDNFVNDAEQQASVIRYGSAVNYLVQMLKDGKAPDYETGRFVVPEPGNFYKTNDALLEGGFYFDERRFMVATVIQDGYESLGDLGNAKYWAYRSIELSMSMEKTEYGIVMLKMFFYPVNDRRFRQAYAVLAYLESWLRERKQRLEVEGNDSGLVFMFQQIEESDVALYHSILLPAAFDFSLDIVEGRVQEAQYKDLIEDIFRNDSYTLLEPEAFEFARRLFEGILLKRLTYPEIEALFEGYNGKEGQSLRAIAYILLATFADAKNAAALHLAILGPLDAAVRLNSAAYRFGMVPYFVRFWHRMVEMRPSEFDTVEHLRAKGWDLVNKSLWDKQVGKLFHVISNHLDLSLPQLAQAVIDRADDFF